MTVDHIRYDILTQDALRGVVRTVLVDAAANGLPGEHHFFISFDTNADGVRISPRLKAQYPVEMTIVLQHQFWDLRVDDDDFEVGLSFNGIPERLTVPFAAVNKFLDPSVQFVLQFAVGADEVMDADAIDQEVDASLPSPQPANPAAAALPGDKADAPGDKDDAGDRGAVVSLDRFRKKK